MAVGIIAIGGAALAIGLIAPPALPFSATALTALIAGGGAVIGIALIAKIVCLVGLGLSIAFQKGAKKQQKQWKDPALEIADLRKKVNANGWEKDSADTLELSSICSESEKTSLSLKHLKKESPNSKAASHSKKINEEAEFVDSFFSKSPLDNKELPTAGHGLEDLDPKIQAAVNEYHTQKEKYEKIIADATAYRSTIETNKQALLTQVIQQQDASKLLVQGGAAAITDETRRFESEIIPFQLEIVEYAGLCEVVIESEAMKKWEGVNTWEKEEKAALFNISKRILDSWKTGNPIDQIEDDVKKDLPSVDLDIEILSYDLKESAESKGINEFFKF